MKKILISFFTLALCLVTLSACSNKKNEDSWLEGKWYSKSWGTTYVFSRNKSNWKIEDEIGNIISQKASKTEDSNSSSMTLVDENGTQYVIVKINNGHIKFQQVSKNGLLGTTAAVNFVKK